MRKRMLDIVCIGLVAMAITLTGCANLGNGKLDVPQNSELLVKYATLKLIEDSDDITAEHVTDRADRLRLFVEADSLVDLAELRAQAEGFVEWDKLTASDRLLVHALFGQIEQEAEQASSPSELEAHVLTIIDWVGEAADLYAR